jgi:hypothetical protein
MPLAGTETVVYASASGSTISTATTTSKGIAALAASFPAHVNTSIATAGAGTLTAAGFVGGLITRTGCTSNFTDTTDSATAIVAALPTEAPINTNWLVEVRNSNPVIQTITGGTGVTLTGESVVPAYGVGYFQVSVTTLTPAAVSMIGIGAHYNAPSGKESAFAVTAFGSSSGTFYRQGNLSAQFSSTGVNPGATGADNVIATYTLPASVFDQAGRGIKIVAKGSFGANTNNKRIKIIFNPSSATLASTVGGSGTTVCDTGTVTTNGTGWQVAAEVYKYGAAGSNTQLGTGDGAIAGATHLGTGGLPALATATESGTIFVAVTGNATTATTDIALNQLIITAHD